MKTIAQQLKVKHFPFIINDSNGNKIYYEYSNGSWWKSEFDSNGNKIYYEDSYGYWVKREFDSEGNNIYYEDSEGNIIDKRKVELLLDGVNKMTKLTPITKTTYSGLADIYFDITIVIDKDNNAKIIDNNQKDWKDVVDCYTLVVKELRISVT